MRKKLLVLFVALLTMACSLLPMGAALAAEQPAFPEAEALEEIAQDDIPESVLAAGSKASSPYYIYVEKGSYTLTVYGKDSSGNYTKRVKSYRVAIGRNNRTPSGKFSILGKERWHSFSAGGHAQYASRYTSNLYIHSPLYGTRNIYDMWTSYYYAIGTAATAGCLRTHCAAAYWVYVNCPVGTTVEIVSGSPKGTSSAGAPALNASNKKYDPTDPGVKQDSGGSSKPTITWTQSGGKYYLYSGGKMQTGWQKVSLEWYYLGSDGVMRTGWQQLNGKWYYFKSGGQMATLWHKVGEDWYYFGTDGIMQIGWVKDDGKWYYLDDNGKMLYSQVIVGAKNSFVVNSVGIMVTGKWEKVGDKWYYANTDGILAKGWMKSGSKWYYMGEDCAMQTGLITVGSKKYYMLPSTGEMMTGWQKVDGAYYFFDTDGVAQTGWLDRGGKWYYLAEDGKMVTGQLELDGVLYTFDANGVMTGQEEINQQNEEQQ